MGEKNEKKVIFVTGGCRSGKSQFALDYANRHFSGKTYLATCEVLDEEMARRVENHKMARGPEWKTIEESIRIVERVEEDQKTDGVILVDCITLWISCLLMKWDDDLRILNEVERLLSVLRKGAASLILVSNEVGMGIVPADGPTRRFRDLAGAANQKIAGAADTVIFMVSGIPIFLKGVA